MPALPHGNRNLNAASAAARSNADFYRAWLEHACNNFAVLLQQIVDAPAGPVVIHCHVGKDRTRLAVALALFVAGVPEPRSLLTMPKPIGMCSCCTPRCSRVRPIYRTATNSPAS
ncbi:tyrosine-protein phosphatase [Deinococcus alpinitundrae]|uniref:tyrosine-protein phosphatase n=1 Tax=Deinococcus alpinitundrae TaxID=468913 RepID=UPI00137B32DE